MNKNSSNGSKTRIFLFEELIAQGLHKIVLQNFDLTSIRFIFYHH